MKAFADLFAALGEAQEPGDAVAALARYLGAVPAADAAWAVRLLAGQRPPRTVTPRQLRRWTCRVAGLPEWLFTPCRQAVGDLAETAALLYPAGDVASPQPLPVWIEERLLPLADQTPAERRRDVVAAWSELDEAQLLVWNKLLTGGFRPPVQRPQLAAALAEISGLEPARMLRRLSGDLSPTAEGYRALLVASAEDDADDAGGDQAAGTEPDLLDAVLIYAQRGRGRRAAFYCDLTFGLWHDGALVPFARTSEGLDEDELARIDAFVRRHVVERFGPVRAVEPRLVFTLAFDGVEPAPRRKSGLKALAPRVAYQRDDIPPEDADSLETARALLGRAG